MCAGSRWLLVHQVQGQVQKASTECYKAITDNKASLLPKYFWCETFKQLTYRPTCRQTCETLPGQHKVLGSPCQAMELAVISSLWIPEQKGAIQENSLVFICKITQWVWRQWNCLTALLEEGAHVVNISSSLQTFTGVDKSLLVYLQRRRI